MPPTLPQLRSSGLAVLKKGPSGPDYGLALFQGLACMQLEHAIQQASQANPPFQDQLSLLIDVQIRDFQRALCTPHLSRIRPEPQEWAYLYQEIAHFFQWLATDATPLDIEINYRAYLAATNH